MFFLPSVVRLGTFLIINLTSLLVDMGNMDKKELRNTVTFFCCPEGFQKRNVQLQRQQLFQYKLIEHIQIKMVKHQKLQI